MGCWLFSVKRWHRFNCPSFVINYPISIFPVCAFRPWEETFGNGTSCKRLKERVNKNWPFWQGRSRTTHFWTFFIPISFENTWRYLWRRVVLRFQNRLYYFAVECFQVSLVFLMQPFTEQAGVLLAKWLISKRSTRRPRRTPFVVNTPVEFCLLMCLS